MNNQCRVRKTFTMGDDIILDDGTVISIRKKKRETETGLHNRSGYQLTIIRNKAIGKITVTKSQQTTEETDGNR